MLDIPAYIQTSITLSNSFADQKVAIDGGLKGIEMDKPINIDEQLTLTFPASTVFVFEGVDNGNFNFDAVPTPPATSIGTVKSPFVNDNSRMYDLSGRKVSALQKNNVTIVDGKKKVY